MHRSTKAPRQTTSLPHKCSSTFRKWAGPAALWTNLRRRCCRPELLTVAFAYARYANSTLEDVVSRVGHSQRSKHLLTCAIPAYIGPLDAKSDLKSRHRFGGWGRAYGVACLYTFIDCA